VNLDLCLDVHTIALENRSSSPPHRATLAAVRAACRSGAELSHAAGERSGAKTPRRSGLVGWVREQHKVRELRGGAACRGKNDGDGATQRQREGPA
jgi:hypothetical protein